MCLSIFPGGDTGGLTAVSFCLDRYLIWPGDKQRNWDEGGAAFASFPGLQTTFVSARRERVDASYRPLRFARSKPVTGCPSALSSGQGSVRVRLFNVRKIAFRSDVDEALGQVEDMKGEIAAVPSPTNISPLLLPTDSQTLRHYDTCVATSGADVRHSYECVDVSWEAHSLAGEVVINYRSLAWFREAHVAKQKAAMMQSTPHAVCGRHGEWEKASGVRGWGNDVIFFFLLMWVAGREQRSTPRLHLPSLFLSFSLSSSYRPHPSPPASPLAPPSPPVQ